MPGEQKALPEHKIDESEPPVLSCFSVVGDVDSGDVSKGAEQILH